MEISIESFNTHFATLRKSISPLVSKLQVHIDAFADNDKEDRKIAGSCGKSVIFPYLVGFHSSRQNIN